jgi:type I restriction enzyme S subunit
VSKWPKVQLGEISKIITKGTTPTTLGFGFYDKGVNFVKIECISDKGEFITDKLMKITNECHERLKRSQLEENDILFSIAGALGRTAIVDKKILPANTNQALAIIRLKEGIYPKYIQVMLKSDMVFEQFQKQKQGVAQLNLSLQNINELIIYLPLVEEQKEIAEILDKASNLIFLRKKQIEKLDLLVKAKFIDMFGDPISNSLDWKVKPLGDICNMKAGKGIKAVDIYEDNHENLYPCYGGNGLRGYVKNYSHKGELPLIGRQGALCGNVQYAQGEFYATEHAIVTQPKIRMNTYWLYFMLKEMNLNRLSTGAAQPGLNVSTLVPLNVIIPPLDSQSHFALFAERVEYQKSILQQGLEKLELNYKSLMQQYFG